MIKIIQKSKPSELTFDSETPIDSFSDLGIDYDTYTLLASIAAFLIFTGIFEFFSFSPSLSRFIEILRMSATATFYFLAMFTLLLFGYIASGFMFFGLNISNFSDMINSTTELFKIMSFEFDYESLAKVNSNTAVFFISFMLLFSIMLKNMFIALIVSYNLQYDEL